MFNVYGPSVKVCLLRDSSITINGGDVEQREETSRETHFCCLERLCIAVCLKAQQCQSDCIQSVSRVGMSGLPC